MVVGELWLVSFHTGRTIFQNDPTKIAQRNFSQVLKINQEIELKERETLMGA
jgi:hypothetical protein